ncbi:MAG: hypothetical protein ACR2P0_17325 [Acidimicrobiales bacterium]
MTTNVLFLCPHNAAKSVAAAAFLERASADRGLDVLVKTAGTEPDPEVNPIVRNRLVADGLPVEVVPRAVSDDDLKAADIVVNIGCDLAGRPGADATRDWNIPNFSDNPIAAFAAIESHVATLLTELT